MLDDTKEVDIDTLKAMKKKLNDNITEEAVFIEDLQMEINRMMDKQKKR